MKELETNGPEWHRVRNQDLQDLDDLPNYSSSLKTLVK